MSLDITMQTHRDPALDTAWHALHASTPLAEPTLAPAFTALIESTFRPPGQPLWLVARRGNVIVALLHLRRELRWLGGLPHRRLLGGLGWHAYTMDALVGAADATAVARAFATVLTRWDQGSTIHLWRIPAASALRHIALADAVLDATQANPVAVLEPGGGRLGGHAGRNLRRRLRQLDELGAVQVRVLTNVDGNEAIASHFTRMHSALKAMQGQQQTFELAPGAHERFPAAWATYCAGGHGSAVVVELDGRPIGIGLQLHGNGVTQSWRTAWDPEFARFGLGIILMDEAIAASRARGDVRYHLGVGDEEYKRLWVPDPEPCYRLRAVAPGLRTLPLRLYGKLSGRAIV